MAWTPKMGSEMTHWERTFLMDLILGTDNAVRGMAAEGLDSAKLVAEMTAWWNDKAQSVRARGMKRH